MMILVFNWNGDGKCLENNFRFRYVFCKVQEKKIIFWGNDIGSNYFKFQDDNGWLVL